MIVVFALSFCSGLSFELPENVAGVQGSGPAAASAGADGGPWDEAKRAAKQMVFAAARPLEQTGALLHIRQTAAENEALRAENAILQERLRETALTRQELDRLAALSALLDADWLAESAQFLTASVTAVGDTGAYGVFLIDRGTADGVAAGSTVVSREGLAGSVLEAGENWASVAPIVLSGRTVSFAVSDGMGRTVLGAAEGSGRRLSGYLFSDQTAVSEGDTVMTTGLGMYPEGIRIGTVESVEYDRNTLVRSVVIAPAADFAALRKVVILL